MRISSYIDDVMFDIKEERDAQNRTFGLQEDIPLGSSSTTYGVLAKVYRETCDARSRGGIHTDADILLEEVYEALAEDDEDRAEVELIQVAAVAAKMVEKIRLRRQAKENGEALDLAPWDRRE